MQYPVDESLSPLGNQVAESLVLARHMVLADATLVMLEGVHVVPRVVEGDLPASAHHVEYVKAGGLEVPVDHVEVPDGALPKKAAAGR